MCASVELWFGDERGYNATIVSLKNDKVELWFGDERGYNATREGTCARLQGCGLVMKEDITQPLRVAYATLGGCGLVMKEDITQRVVQRNKATTVVVW